jgi:hypothetical protein
VVEATSTPFRLAKSISKLSVLSSGPGLPPGERQQAHMYRFVYPGILHKHESHARGLRPFTLICRSVVEFRTTVGSFILLDWLNNRDQIVKWITKFHDTVLQLGGAFDRAPTCLSTSLEGISQTTTVT